MHHRRPGPVPEFLAAAQRGQCILEMIGDGVHFPVMVQWISPKTQSEMAAVLFRYLHDMTALRAGEKTAAQIRFATTAGSLSGMQNEAAFFSSPF